MSDASQREWRFYFESVPPGCRVLLRSPVDRFKKNILSRKRGDLFLPESYIGWKEKIAARKQTPFTRLKPGRQNRIPPFSSDLLF